MSEPIDLLAEVKRTSVIHRLGVLSCVRPEDAKEYWPELLAIAHYVDCDTARLTGDVETLRKLVQLKKDAIARLEADVRKLRQACQDSLALISPRPLSVQMVSLSKYPTPADWGDVKIARRSLNVALAETEPPE